MAGQGSLEDRIQRLEDIEEIRSLRMRYHYCVNEGIYRQAAELYTEDAFVRFGSLAEARGREAIADLFDRLERNVTVIRQFVVNHMITFEGDGASGISYLDARYAQEGKSIIAAVRYDDVYRRTGDGWKMSEMIARVDFAVPLTQGWAEGSLDQTRMLVKG